MRIFLFLFYQISLMGLVTLEVVFFIIGVCVRVVTLTILTATVLAGSAFDFTLHGILGVGAVRVKGNRVDAVVLSVVFAEVAESAIWKQEGLEVPSV